MALIGKIAIAMGVNTRPLAAGLAKSAGMVTGFQAKIEQTGGALKALFAGAAAYGAAKALKSMVGMASDLNENMSKTHAIFGSGAKTVVAAADEMAAAFGTSKNEFLDASAKMGGLFKGAGFAADEAARLSVNWTKLAADASSFFNLSFGEAFAKIRSGLSGESEPLKDLGILMNEDMVKAQALAMGLGKAGQELSNQAKIQARAAIIAKGLADAQGDLARTADDVANASRGLTGRIENLASAMGTALLPIAQTVLGEISTAVSALTLAWEDNQAQVIAWANQTISGAGESVKTMGMLQRSIGWIADAWDVMRLTFSAVQSYITWGLGQIIGGYSKLVRVIDYVIEKTTGFKSGYGDFLKTYGEDLTRLSEDQWAGFMKQIEKPWPSESINDYFAKAQEKIQAVRKEAVKGGIGISKIPSAAGNAAKAEGPKFASAMAAGSKEAANAVLRSRYSAGAAGPQQQTAKNTAKTVDLLTQAVQGINAMARQRVADATSMLLGGNL